jgi:hypothetical protein
MMKLGEELRHSFHVAKGPLVIPLVCEPISSVKSDSLLTSNSSAKNR